MWLMARVVITVRGAVGACTRKQHSHPGARRCRRLGARSSVWARSALSQRIRTNAPAAAPKNFPCSLAPSTLKEYFYQNCFSQVRCFFSKLVSSPTRRSSFSRMFGQETASERNRCVGGPAPRAHVNFTPMKSFRTPINDFRRLLNLKVFGDFY